MSQMHEIIINFFQVGVWNFNSTFPRAGTGVHFARGVLPFWYTEQSRCSLRSTLLVQTAYVYARCSTLLMHLMTDVWYEVYNVYMCMRGVLPFCYTLPSRCSMKCSVHTSVKHLSTHFSFWKCIIRVHL